MKISYRQHYDGRRDGETGNVLIVFGKSEEHFWKHLSVYHGTGTGNEGESQEEEEDDDDQVDFGSRVSLNSSTQENEAYAERETGTNYKFGVVRTIIKDTNTPGQSRDFVSITNSEIRTKQNRKAGLSNATADPEVDNAMTSSPRIKARISFSKATCDRQGDTATGHTNGRKRSII